MLVSTKVLRGADLAGAVTKDLLKHSTKSMACTSSSPSLGYSFPPSPVAQIPKLYVVYQINVSIPAFPNVHPADSLINNKQFKDGIRLATTV